MKATVAGLLVKTARKPESDFIDGELLVLSAEGRSEVVGFYAGADSEVAAAIEDAPTMAPLQMDVECSVLENKRGAYLSVRVLKCRSLPDDYRSAV